jgi:hypothetical protein
MENSIKVGYDSITNLYTFKIFGGFSVKNVCVNGQPITDPLRGQKVGELITIKEQPEVITYETSERKLIGYDNIETITTISVKQYHEIVNQIAETRKYDEDSDEYTYETLEGEIFANRFFRNHKAIYQTIETVHNMNIEFISLKMYLRLNVNLHQITFKHLKIFVKQVVLMIHALTSQLIQA